MAKVDLSYNPYLPKTEILFNEKKPRINSLVEKYERSSIYSWLDKMASMMSVQMEN